MGLLYCKQNFVRVMDGRRHHVRRGDIVHENDPVVTGAESCFDRVDDLVKCFADKAHVVVEQATNAPGEKRVIPSRGRPRKEKPPVVDDKSAKGDKEEDKDNA